MTETDLIAQIGKIGVDKIRFMAPFKSKGAMTPLGFMTSSSDPEEIVMCRITEERYKIADKYKISITSTKTCSMWTIFRQLG